MTTPDTARPLRVGMVGHAFMGAAHSHAWRTAPRFFDLPLTPELTVLAGRDQTRVTDAARRLGWASTETDWRALVERDDVDLVDICTPGDTHAEIAIAALNAGKHVLCEKPLANSVAEAEDMADAAAEAAARGVYAMCGYSYRRTPALALARYMVRDGRLGTIRQVRAQYLQDWLSDENAPLTWRMDKSKSGSGALGDIGAHSIDAAQFVTGQSITGVSAIMETFTSERPVGGDFVGLGGSGAVGAGAERGPVTVDDAVVFSARFDGGPIGVFEASRVALGRKNAMRLEVNGSEGLHRVRLRGHELPELLRRRQRRRAGFARFPPDQRHGGAPPVHRQLVAGGPRAGLRTRLHAPGGGPRDGHRRRNPAHAVVRRCPPGAAGAGGGRTQRRRGFPLDPSGRTRRTYSMTTTKNALVVRGGWDGHQPVEATDLFIPFLREQGYGVRVEESTAVYADAAYLAGVDLIVQCNTMNTIEKAEFEGLRAAIAGGTGMAGWHGGIADSYRNSSDYLHLIGGQFACHPSKDYGELHGDATDNFRTYTVNMLPAAAEHPITAGIGDFELFTEQYWVLSDDYIDVLATTTLPARDKDAWHRGRGLAGGLDAVLG